MFKTLKNLFIIALICVIGMGISVNSSPVENNLNLTSNTDNNIEVFLTSNIKEDILFNPKTIIIKHESTGNETLFFHDDYLLKGKIYKNNQYYKTHDFYKIQNDKPFTLKLTKSNPYITTLNISQDTLDIPNGIYEIVITTNAIGKKYSSVPLKLNVEYFSNSSYIKAQNTAPDGKTGLTLYFPDKDNRINELIGITRFVNNSNNLLNTTMDELKNGPSANSGLSSFSPVGKYNYITTKDNITYIDLPSSDSLYTSDTQCQISMTSMLKSVLSLKRVSQIKFLVDYSRADTFFGGIDIKDLIKKDFNNKTYLAYDNSKRYYLVDCEVSSITEYDSIEEKASKVFLTLKDGEYHGLWNTVPKDVDVIGFQLDNKTLKINFNKNFIDSFNGNTDLQQMMLDSILFSFTSIDEVKYIQILVEGNAIDSFAGIKVNEPLARPLYINPE